MSEITFKLDPSEYGSIGRLNCRSFDIISHESILTREKIQRDEDRNFFRMINDEVDQMVLKEILDAMEIENLRTARKPINSIFELEIE